jgi:acetolactate decarboxylase
MLICLLLAASCTVACVAEDAVPHDEGLGPSSSPDIIYQVSTLSALLEGVYNGSVSYGEVREHGDFGVGCGDGLEGEMVLLDGSVYIIPYNGSAYQPSDDMTTPLSVVTFFAPDDQFAIGGPTNLTQLNEAIAGRFPSTNLFYAIRVDGTFSYMKTRSIPRQTPPYPRLAEVVEQQSVFEWNGVNGTMVGIWCPEWAGAINVAGFHFHFLDENRTSGGHVLDLILDEGMVGIDTSHEYMLVLPSDPGYYTADISTPLPHEVQMVEQAQ